MPQSKNKHSESPHYEVTIPSRLDVIGFLITHIKPVHLRALVEHFELQDPRQQEGMRRRLRAMERDGELVFTRAETLGLPDRMGLLKGKVIGHRDGFGFVQSEQSREDIFLPPHQMKSVMHGDIIFVQASQPDHKGRMEGRVVRVLEPMSQPIVGRFHLETRLEKSLDGDVGFGYVTPEDSRIHQDILIPKGEQGEAKEGQIVTVAITQRPNRRNSPIGKVLEVLGDHMAPGMEIDVAIRQHGLPHEWPDAVLKQVRSIPTEVSDKDKKHRKDLRRLPFVTIDGEDARDFDDAVYCVQEEKGFRLFVAIADVSHYVRAHSPLDEEARVRGNSVYFPDHVIPMLPFELSAGLCSLQEGQTRLAFVCEMEIGARGKLKSYQFYPATIQSHARMTYTEVAGMIDQFQQKAPQQDTEAESQPPHAYQEQIKDLYATFKALRQARERRGAIDFESQETRILFDDERKIKAIEPIERHEAHQVIEECMVIANVAAAKFVEQYKADALFRVHEEPNEEKFDNFKLLLGELGIFLPYRLEPEAAHFNQVLQESKDRPDYSLIEMMLLRSLQQAVYQPENKGHFGLALPSYSHFTSPIRRYSDLILHRVMKAILVKHQNIQLDNAERLYALQELETIGYQVSMTERRAEEASRDVMEWLKCEFMESKIGEVYAGTISSVTNFGLFVRIDELGIDGLIHISYLPPEYYHYDAKRQILIGEHTRTVFRLGDKVTIQVTRVSLDDRKIDFDLVEHESSESFTLENMPVTPKAERSRSKKNKGKDESGSKAKRRGSRRKKKHSKKNRSKKTK